MKSKTFTCPSCNLALQMELAPAKSPKNPQPYYILHCGNSRCPSPFATNDGGTGDTEEAAYRSLLLAVKHEEDKEIEQESEPLTPEELRERNEIEKAEHANDLSRSGGA